MGKTNANAQGPGERLTSEKINIATTAITVISGAMTLALKENSIPSGVVVLDAKATDGARPGTHGIALPSAS
jgi:hypothetical protein